MRKKLYFNGVYLIKGRKFLGRIRGKVIASHYSNIYKIGDNVSIPENDKHFKEITEEQLEVLKKFDFIKDGNR